MQRKWITDCRMQTSMDFFSSVCRYSVHSVVKLTMFYSVSSEKWELRPCIEEESVQGQGLSNSRISPPGEIIGGGDWRALISV